MLRTARSIAAVVAATVAASACHGAPPAPITLRPVVIPDDVSLRTRIATLEAMRGAGVDELIQIAAARGSTDAARDLALRGLGRIGGARAYRTLLDALKDRSAAVPAANALGVLGSLDELPAAQTADLTKALKTALGLPLTAAQRIDLIEALGRAGDEQALELFGLVLADVDRSAREVAAMSMARFGRRKIAWGATRAALVKLVDDDAVRYSAIYALAREHAPPTTEQQQLARSLAKRLSSDAEPMVRAVAAQALAHQALILGEANPALVKALLDTDWRVSIEAARALASDKSDDASRDRVAEAMLHRAKWVHTTGFEEQAVVEMMRLLLPYASRPAVSQAFDAAEVYASTQAPITRSWLECLSADRRVRAANGASYDELVKCSLLPHLVAPLIADIVTDKIGPIAVRRAQIWKTFTSDDPRIRAAGLGAMSALWPDLGDPDRSALIDQLASAVADKDPIVAGAAIDAVEGFFEAAKTTRLTKKLETIDAAAVKRAAEEKDAELGAAAIELVGKRKLAAGLEACRAQLGGAPVVASAARKCLRAFGESPADPTEPAAATAPPVTLVSGNDKLLWILTTTRGNISIELDPTEAAWAVSSIVALTEKHAYDGLEMHRVVPNFVAQGGDPTQSGWGGPGYSLPAEPTSKACLVEGGVGMADAGRDSAGSQWFIMHTWAPHLDARYTCVGRVVDGAKAANALLIGDRVLAARIERGGH